MFAIRAHRLYWSLVAVVACLVLGGSVAWPQQSPSQSAGNQHENADKPASQGAEGTPKDKPAVAQAPGNDGGDGNQEKNQTDNKPSTSWFASFVSFFEAHDKFWVAFGTIVIAVFTAILGGSTIFLWRATTRLVIGAEDTARRQLRAYLKVTPDGINQLIDSDLDVMGHVAVQNVGALPARNVSVNVRMKLGNGRISDLTALPVPGDLWRIERVIQPGDRMIQGSEDRETISKIAAGSWENVYVWGVVYYDDGYNGRRFTRFCHRYATASRNRDAVDMAIMSGRSARETRIIIDAAKARYHTHGNDAD